MPPIKIYYELDQEGNIVATPAATFDAQHTLDDASDEYETMSNAMCSANCDEVVECIYEIGEDETLESVLAYMAEHGFDMQKTEAFSAFVASFQ